MLFFLGYIAGIATAGLIVAALAYFKSPLERFANEETKELHNAGPRPRGAIYMPRDEADVARDRVVAENRARGVDTPVGDLM